MNLSVKILLIGLIICLAMQKPSATERDADTDVILKANAEYIATYSVNARGFDVGTLETKVLKLGNIFTMSTRTKANRLAALISNSELSDECQFELLNDQSIRAISYLAKRTGSKGYNSLVNYDWENREIVYRDNSKLEMPSAYLLDNCNLYIAVVLSKGKGPLADPFRVLDANERRSRGFKVMSVNSENIKTKFGTLLVLKVAMTRTDVDNKTSTFWVSHRTKSTDNDA